MGVALNRLYFATRLKACISWLGLHTQISSLLSVGGDTSLNIFIKSTCQVMFVDKICQSIPCTAGETSGAYIMFMQYKGEFVLLTRSQLQFIKSWTGLWSLICFAKLWSYSHWVRKKFSASASNEDLDGVGEHSRTNQLEYCGFLALSTVGVCVCIMCASELIWACKSETSCACMRVCVTTVCSIFFVAPIFCQYLSRFHIYTHQSYIDLHELKLPFMFQVLHLQ